MQKATIVTVRGKKQPNGQWSSIDRVMIDGKQVGPDVEYWAWSDKSCEQADKIVMEIIRNNDAELSREW